MVISVMGLFFFVRSEIRLEAFGQFAAGEQDAPPATLAFQTDVRAEARDGPFVGAAWMLLAQAQVIVEAQVREHREREQSGVIIN
jgi:hypothetical protein